MKPIIRKFSDHSEGDKLHTYLPLQFSTFSESAPHGFLMTCSVIGIRDCSEPDLIFTYLHVHRPIHGPKELEKPHYVCTMTKDEWTVLSEDSRLNTGCDTTVEYPESCRGSQVSSFVSIWSNHRRIALEKRPGPSLRFWLALFTCRRGQR